MRLMSKVIVAGFATLGLAGSAVAADHAIHTMNVAMPDGSLAKLRYIGDHAPRVTFVPIAVRPMPMIDPSFAVFDRMVAAMDARADAMMRQATMMAQTPPSVASNVHRAVMVSQPTGTVRYSSISTVSSGGCTQTVRTVSDGSDQQPQVIRTSAGKCDGAKAMPAVTNGQAPAKAATAAKPAEQRPDPNTI